MLEAGKGPKAALLCAGGSRDVQGCREGSKALTLGHWRWIDTLPGKLKRGGIINKSASMGLRVKRVATERDQPANGWSPTTNDVAALGTQRWGGKNMAAQKGSSSFFTATGQIPIEKLPGSQWNDPGSPALLADGSHVPQCCDHTPLLSQQKSLTRTGTAVTCRPAERTQPSFNEASLIALLWGALCKEGSCCFPPLERRQLAQGCTGGHWHNEQE